MADKKEHSQYWSIFIGNAKAKGMPLWPAGHFSKWIKVTLMLQEWQGECHFVIGWALSQ
jgi:hypothetical protein